MGTMKVRFLKSGVKPSDYPFPYKPEVALVGRSNAGKSTFINAFCGQKVAKVSQTPGKTRLLNFFEIGEQVYLVDMPGYGFATGNRAEIASWKEMIENYLTSRESLKGVILVMDIRREWSEDEELLRRYFAHHGIPWALVLSKADKLSRSAGQQRQRLVQKTLGTEVPVFIVSGQKREGIEPVKNLVLKEWAK